MKFLILSFIIIIVFSSVKANMFDSPINYFDEETPESAILNKKSRKIIRKKKNFNWGMYLNESNDEFFKEGNYIPPAPFMETMRRPTRKNILFFEEWKSKRNRLLRIYNKERNRILGLNGFKRKLKIKTSNKEIYNALKKYRIMFYFSTTCSSCKLMFNVINRLVDNGVYVEAVRVDPGNDTVANLKIPWTPVSVKEYSLIKKLSSPLTDDI